MDNQNELLLTKDDFTVFGEARTVAVDMESDYNFINSRGDGRFWWTFSIGDDLTTYRGITIGSSMEEVFEKYAEDILLPFNPKNDYLLLSTLTLHKDEYDKDNDNREVVLGDFINLKGNETWIEYPYAETEMQVVYFIRFYFDSDDRVVLIGFYNLSLEEASEKLLEDFYRKNNVSYGPEYHVVYDVQYKILPQMMFASTEETIKAMSEHKDLVYDLVDASFKSKLNKECPYKSEDIIVSNKLLFVDNETFNMITIKFNIEFKGVLAKSIYIVYDSKLKNARYFTAENDEFGDEDSIIHLCEVYKDGRQNYGKMNYDESAVEKAIIDIYNDKVVTTGMITKFPKAKVKKKEINVNDKAWIGIRGDKIRNWKNYEPDSKIKKVDGLLILGLEEGSPLKECNISFDTANFITKFDGVKVSNAESFRELLDKYKPKDKVIITIESYDSDMDKFLSNEYKIVLASLNEETYEFKIDMESLTSKMNHYAECFMREND